MLDRSIQYCAEFVKEKTTWEGFSGNGQNWWQKAPNSEEGKLSENAGGDRSGYVFRDGAGFGVRTVPYYYYL